VEFIHPLPQHSGRSHYYDRAVEHFTIVQGSNKGYELY
jgi:hypothetical protein